MGGAHAPKFATPVVQNAWARHPCYDENPLASSGPNTYTARCSSNRSFAQSHDFVQAITYKVSSTSDVIALDPNPRFASITV